MDRKDARADGRQAHADADAAVRHSLEYLRKRSLHRIWWSSARVAMQRGQAGEPPRQPNGLRSLGKRV